jgi:hypothetical protein
MRKGLWGGYDVEVITSKVLRSPPWLGWQLWNICVTNDYGYVPLVVNASRSFPHSWLITGFITDDKGAYQNPYIEEQTTQCPKEKVQKDKHRSTKPTHDRVTRIPLKAGGELRYSGRVSSSCSTSGTRRVNLVINPVISHIFKLFNVDYIN